MEDELSLIDSQGNVTLNKYFYSDTEANDLFLLMQKTLPWKQEIITIFNKSVACPRLIDWSGDQGVNYTYSKNKHIASGWDPILLSIKEKIECRLKYSFNFVLCNLYRDGQDYMGWHDDGEKSQGKEPIIASLSFGAERKFEFRNKQSKALIKLTLNAGSLLVMSDETQVYWQHRLPKDNKCHTPRINLTFRNIVDA